MCLLDYGFNEDYYVCTRVQDFACCLVPVPLFLG